MPDDREAFIQFIDVRALSRFATGACSRNRPGVFNLIGPGQPARFLEFIGKTKEVLNPELRTERIKDTPGRNFPMYAPGPELLGIFQISGEKTYAAGLEEIRMENTIMHAAQQ